MDEKASNRAIIGYREQQRTCKNCSQSYERHDAGVGDWLMCSLLDSMDKSTRKWNPVKEVGVCDKWQG